MSDINNTQLLADSGLRVVHVRPFYAGEGRGVVTVAFREPQHRGHTIEIATSVCSPRDTFCKKVGTKQALENFQAGRTIRVPDFDKHGPVYALKALFG